MSGYDWGYVWLVVFFENSFVKFVPLGRGDVQERLAIALGG